MPELLPQRCPARSAREAPVPQGYCGWEPSPTGFQAERTLCFGSARSLTSQGRRGTNSRRSTHACWDSASHPSSASVKHLRWPRREAVRESRPRQARTWLYVPMNELNVVFVFTGLCCASQVKRTSDQRMEAPANRSFPSLALFVLCPCSRHEPAEARNLSH